MAGRDVSYLDQKIADSKITEAQRKAYLWLGEQLFGWRYLPAIGALTDREGRTASEGAALRWLQTPNAVAEVMEAMNKKKFYLIYEEFEHGPDSRTGHRAGFDRGPGVETSRAPLMCSLAQTFVEAVLTAAYLVLRHENGEAPEL